MKLHIKLFSYPPIFMIISGIFISVIVNLLIDFNPVNYSSNVIFAAILILLSVSCICFIYIGLTTQEYKKIEDKKDKGYYHMAIEGISDKLYIALTIAILCMILLALIRFGFYNIPNEILLNNTSYGVCKCR